MTGRGRKVINELLDERIDVTCDRRPQLQIAEKAIDDLILSVVPPTVNGWPDELPIVSRACITT